MINMDSEITQTITVEIEVNATLQKVLGYWTLPEHIVCWNAAAESWHTTKANNDLQVGGHFSYRMEAKDGSFGFDFHGTYTAVEPHALIAFTLGDGRRVSIIFSHNNGLTKVSETFEPENENAIELQKEGWQAILDNFKKYTQAN
jgi:uncharacterized protein YndB with AHSA1/START domain